MEINWFNVFDSNNSEWLQDDEHSWGPYSEAAEFTNYETAYDVALRESKFTQKVARSVIIFGDCGMIFDP